MSAKKPVFLYVPGVGGFPVPQQMGEALSGDVVDPVYLGTGTHDNTTVLGGDSTYHTYVASWNGRIGVVALTAADVDAALPADVAQTDVANTFTAGPQTFQGAAPTSQGGSPGTQNERWGINAGAALTTAVSVLCFGANAGQSTTTGSFNLFLGPNAGRFNISGAQNTYVGYQAGYSATGGSNTFVGGNSGQASTADNCTYLGWQAGYNATGTKGVFIGVNAGLSSTGASNDLFGYQAGFALTTGAGNTVIGDSAASATLSTGSNNVLIGASTDTAVTGTASGIALGYQAICASNEFAVGPNINVETLYGKSSTNAVRQRADWTVSWVDSTDATRKARFVLNAWDTAAREVMRGEGDGSNPRVGFLGANAVARPTVTGSRGANAALASLLTALAGLGLITDSST